MANITATQVREDCILFAATYPSPNVRRAVELAESGRITWEQVEGLFKKALVAGLAA